jgi:large subunit ribosomal protein L9
MKVILLKDVAKIGRRFEVVNVPDGYALNKLIPKNMAQAATPENMKRLQHMASKLENDKEAEASTFAEALSVLKDTLVDITVDANNEGKMFQALKVDAIAFAIQSATGFTIGAEHIEMKTPIKTVGEHEVTLTMGEVHGVAKLHLIAKSK